MPGKKRRRQTKKQIRTKEKLKRILMENPEITYGELKKRAPEIFEILSPKQILGMIGYLKSPISKVLEASRVPSRKPPAQAEMPSETPAEIPLSQSKLPREKSRIEVGSSSFPTPKLKSDEGKVGGTPPLDKRPAEEAFIVSGVERELWLKATPIIRKIVLNPIIYLWFDYAKSEFKDRLPKDYDIGDFLIDCVQDFWKSRGYKIKITRVEEKEVA